MPIEINQAKRYIMKDGEQGYQEWRASLVDKPEKRAIFEEIAAKNDLWLQLVEARQAAGLSVAKSSDSFGRVVHTPATPFLLKGFTRVCASVQVAV